MHHYFARTGFYLFLWTSLKKAIIPLLLLVAAVLLVNKYVFNINAGLQQMTNTFSAPAIFAVFFLSESFLGLLPPELFIAWTKKTTHPLIFVSILSVLSYFGGIVSYFVGKLMLHIESLKTYLEVKMANNLKNSKKWGGLLILVGAVLPLPFSMACITAGMIKYPFKNLLFFGLFRFVRFAVYAWAIFSVVS